MEQSSTPILQLQNVSKKYGNFQAVKDVSLSVSEGEFLTLLGPSGSGKTTLLQMISGFVQPTEGKIILYGKDISHTPPNKRNMGFVFQDYALFPHMNIFQNIAYPLKIRKKRKAEIQKAVEKTIELVQLKEFSHRKPNELSGGQQQRVALARALVFKPDLILMDEPLGALDKKLREYFQIEIKKIQSITGVTIIFVTHDQEEALAMSDRIAVMNRSQMVQLGSATELYENPNNYFVADFIGQNNFLEGIVTELQGDKITIQLEQGQFIKVNKNFNDAKENQKIKVSIRPEKLMLANYQDHDDSYSSIKGVIANKIYLGDTFKYVVKIQGEVKSFELTVVTKTNSVLDIGRTVYVTWKNEDMKLLINEKPESKEINIV